MQGLLQQKPLGWTEQHALPVEGSGEAPAIAGALPGRTAAASGLRDGSGLLATMQVGEI